MGEWTDGTMSSDPKPSQHPNTPIPRRPAHHSWKPAVPALVNAEAVQVTGDVIAGGVLSNGDVESVVRPAPLIPS
jgi:hypothetical protein